MFRGWQARAARDGKAILCMIVLGLTNDVKFCSEKTAAGQSADCPKNVGYLMDQLEKVLAGWSRQLDTPVVYVGAAASYHTNPRRVTSEVRLDNVNSPAQARTQHAMAMARIHNLLEAESVAGAFPTFQSGRVYFVQKPMTDFSRCDWVGHPHVTEWYLQAVLTANTISYVLQKSGLFTNMKCKCFESGNLD